MSDSGMQAAIMAHDALLVQNIITNPMLNGEVIRLHGIIPMEPK